MSVVDGVRSPMNKGRYPGPPAKGGLRPSSEVSPPPAAEGAKTAPAPRRRVTGSSNPAEAIGVFFLLAFLFLAYSRVLDFKTASSSLHIPFIVSLLAFLAAVLSGGVKRALTSRPGALYLLLTIWFVIGLPFGVWRSNSLEVLRLAWSKSVLMFVLTAGLLTTISRCRKAMLTVALGAVVITSLCLVLRAESETGQRIWLPTGVLENSNDLAQILLIGLPFLGLAIAWRAANIGLRLLAVVFMPLILYVIFQTGSRSAMVTLVTLTLVILFNVSAASKFKMLGAMGAALMMFIAFVPGSLKDRYTTLFEHEGPMMSETEKAASSANQRRFVLKQSVVLTARNPLFGVGLGNFQPEAARIANEFNRHAAWLETHNSYTQVSSEAGLPALFLFCAILWYSTRHAFALFKATSRHPELEEVTATAFCVFLGIVNFSITVLFTSVAYHPFMPTLVGISTAVILAGRQEVADFEAYTGKVVFAPKKSRAIARPRAAIPTKPVRGFAPASRSLSS
jgi:O-antigen ligase